MKNIELIDKLKFIIATSETRKDATSFLRISGYLLNNTLAGTANPSATTVVRINKAFNERLRDDVFHIIATKYKEPNIKYVENYDDDGNLTDLKTYNSKHGVNKSSRAFSGHSN